MATTLGRFSNIATDPLRNFRFYAVFEKSGGATNTAAAGVFNDKITSFSGGFQTITGLSVNTQPIPYREGGYNTTIHQVPGMTTFTPVTMQRGALAGNEEAITWMKGLFAAGSGEGIAIGAGKDFRVDIKVYVLDHPNTADTFDPVANARMGFKIHNAWITTLAYSDLNAGDQGLLFESMTIVHEGLSIATGVKQSDGTYKVKF